MSEETPTTQEVPQYEPQPRGEARIAGINIEAIDARLAECAEYFQKHVDEQITAISIGICGACSFGMLRVMTFLRLSMMPLWQLAVFMTDIPCIWNSSRPKCL